jgi:uncharacterized protein YjbI with pentapeptide repeats
LKERELLARWGVSSEVRSRGITTEGLADFRGIALPDISERLEFINADLSLLRAGGTKLRESRFVNCVFRKADFRNAVESGGLFEACKFDNVRFAKSVLGVGTSRYSGCSFVDCIWPTAMFANAVFRDCEISGTFKKVDCGTSGFWNCKFTGTVDSIWIKGGDPYDASHRPVDAGLHGVDFSGASLSDVTISDRCPIVDVLLPEGALFVDVRLLTPEFVARAQSKLSAEVQEAFSTAVWALRVHSQTQNIIIVTRAGLLEKACGKEADKAFGLLAEAVATLPLSG